MKGEWVTDPELSDYIKAGMFKRSMRIAKGEERVKMVAHANALICFDHVDQGSCEHSVCYAMLELIEKIER